MRVACVHWMHVQRHREAMDERIHHLKATFLELLPYASLKADPSNLQPAWLVSLSQQHSRIQLLHAIVAVKLSFRRMKLYIVTVRRPEVQSALCREAMARDSQNAKAHLRAGSACLLLARPQEAADSFHRALTLAPDSKAAKVTCNSARDTCVVVIVCSRWIAQDLSHRQAGLG